MPRIGVLAGRSWQKEAFDRGLREHGWIEGQNVLVRVPEGRGLEPGEIRGRRARACRTQGRLHRCRRESDGRRRDGIRFLRPARYGARRRSRRLAIVARLARPGGRVTGFSNSIEALSGKRLDLLKERDLPGSPHRWSLKSPSTLLVTRCGTAPPSARSRASRSLPPTTGVLTDSTPPSLQSEKRRTGSWCQTPPSAASGGGSSTLPRKQGCCHLPKLACRGERGPDVIVANGADRWRRAAVYVDKILQGCEARRPSGRAADAVELVINRKTANALGLTIPQPISCCARTG